MRGNRRLVLAGVALFVLVLAAVVQQRSLRDLRQLEGVYLAGRQVTACATRQLQPFAADTDPEVGQIDAAVERLVTGAATDSRAVRARLDDVSVFPLRSLRAARGDVELALEAQVKLYDVLVATPEDSRDELVTLGRSNNRAERRLSRARNVLLVGEPTGWDARFRCRS